MSYTRRYSESITVRGSKTVSVSYPASQNGGSTTATVNYTEIVPVDVNINVDTVPFDSSVNDCNASVDLLTGSVVATEVAQIQSIDENSRKISKTLISGFFGYIRSELSQQTAELSSKIDSQLMHLRELAKACLSKKEQMRSDYLRISERYSKIFDDLNNELDNRVLELDKPAFNFREEVERTDDRLVKNDLVSSVSIYGSELGGLFGKVSSSLAKKSAENAIVKTRDFLSVQNKLDRTVEGSMFNERVSKTNYIPVLFMNSVSSKNTSDGQFYCPEYLSSSSQIKKTSIQRFKSRDLNWLRMDSSSKERIKSSYRKRVNRFYDESERGKREKEIAIKLFENCNTKTTQMNKI